MTQRRRKINEGILDDIGSQARKLLDIPIIKSITDYFADEDEESDEPESAVAKKLDFSKELSNLTTEMIPLNIALQANKGKKALVVGSSQAGIIGPPVMRGLESRGFKDFNFGASPAKSMRFVYTAVATAVRNKQEYDVVIIFPGYRIGESVDAVENLIDLFSHGRCFVVIPPPVTAISDVFEASRLGLNRGNAIPADYWFVLRNGEYSSERESYCRDLKNMVEKMGATSIDPRDVVTGGNLQISGINFPDSPDGIHVGQEVAQEIAKAVVDAVFSCDKPVPATEVVDKIAPGDLDRDSRIVTLFSDYPSTAAILSAYVGTAKRGSFGWRSDHPVHHDSRMHWGIDISAPTGTPVKAALDGNVIVATDDAPGTGGTVQIQHANGDKTRYLHLSKIMVAVGQPVKKGDVIALSGGQPGTKGAGTSTGPHLHWETKVGDSPIDPFDWLATNTNAIKPIEFNVRNT